MAIPNQQIVHNGGTEEILSVNEDKKKPARGGGKRKRTTKKEIEKKGVKKARATKTKEEPEYFEEKRNLEDLWKVASPVGIEWEEFDNLYKCNWQFKSLEEALEEGGMLYGKKVFVFVVTPEPQLLTYKDAVKVVNIPTVI
ncbi:uncharacterized protein LOC110229072 [Arabidopsis lyrata subsp. lyrata]|uniref:uncharacterized protein LOC110229072 n=1 Tax=Arabidopsis lyrata subsp. lyrata TaxID=81972 RepID=UPI000A29DB99|nr:uncharacterized protein LOC110229072 [Arabidopsis lyrata subsp. lyrata]|eukprot:XP_020883557.1 uncharacterized protein LOC110229072 [Arabidopsis lyrata subsp. lyrata]